MHATVNYLAFDLGASSGRAALGCFDGHRLELRGIHRFDNGPVRILDRLHWDTPRLFTEIKLGLAHAAAAVDALDGVGIDTWGVDFGLLSSDGELLGLPYHYRDRRTQGLLEAAFERVPRAEIYAYTGIQFMELNTLYQLLALRLANSPVLESAERLLFTPDLLNYWITGEQCSEYTIASTSQLLDAQQRLWSHELMAGLDLPLDIMPPIVPPATVLGELTPALHAEVGLGATPVIAPACHDTAAAVAATPLASANAAYISLGTWALIGMELPAPICTPDALAANFTNEGGVAGTIRFLKNVTGLWLLQESKRVWDTAGGHESYEDLARLAANAPALRSFVDPDQAEFAAPGDMPRRVRAFCERTRQPAPESKGALVRSILESLALKCHANIALLERLTDRNVDTIHVVGGGAQNTLLCQFIANATGRLVLAGPVEATAAGNVMVQALARGRVSSLVEIREIMRRSTDVAEYQPRDSQVWTEAQSRFAESMAHPQIGGQVA